MTYCRDERPVPLGDARVSRLYGTYCYSITYMCISVSIRGSFTRKKIPDAVSHRGSSFFISTHRGDHFTLR